MLLKPKLRYAFCAEHWQLGSELWVFSVFSLDGNDKKTRSTNGIDQH